MAAVHSTRPPARQSSRVGSSTIIALSSRPRAKTEQTALVGIDGRPSRAVAVACAGAASFALGRGERAAIVGLLRCLDERDATPERHEAARYCLQNRRE